MTFKIGDLVRVRRKEWLSRSVGIITEVKDLIHQRTETEYTVVTVVVENKYYTFSDKDLELVKRINNEE